LRHRHGLAGFGAGPRPERIAGRLAGDRVVGRLGAVRALRVSGGLAANGARCGTADRRADRGDRGVRSGGRGNREHPSRAVHLDRARRRWRRRVCAARWGWSARPAPSSRRARTNSPVTI